MNDFTASNGLNMSHLDGGGLRVAIPPDRYEGWQKMNLAPTLVNALREYFQAEVDERAGLWRSKKDPTWTALREGDVVFFQNADHQRGFSAALVNDAWKNTWSPELVDVAREYVEAHPEPKPWHDAKRGEVWIVDTHIRTWGGEQPMFVSEDRKFHNSSWSLPVNDPDVRSARRIWPEVSDGD